MRDTIETDRLTLRPLRPSDAGPMTLWCSQFRVASMLARVPHPYPPGAAEAFIARAASAKSDETVWAIDGSRSDAADFLGVVGVRRPEGATPARFGYWIAPPAWGLGYATEATAAALDAAFEDPASKDPASEHDAAHTAEALAVIEASVTQDNPASRRVLDKLGFRAVEEIGEFCFARGETVPATRLRLERPDWLAIERPFKTETGE